MSDSKFHLDLKGKRVTVMGLGLHGGGVATALWLLKHGAIVTVTDIKKRSELRSSLSQLSSTVTAHLGRHVEEDFVDAAMIVRNPAVPNDSPWLALARKNGVPIENEATLFFKHCQSTHVIGVTGTRGKSTTATMIEAILRAWRQSEIPALSEVEGLNLKSRIWLAGNIRTTPMLSIVDRVKPDDVVVLEFSSWHLETMDEQGVAPHIAVVTNVLPDHLNRYASMRAYARAKESIVRHQKKGDIAVLNKENVWTRAMAKKTKVKVVWFANSRDPFSVKLQRTGLRILGEHNMMNAQAAASVARAIGIPMTTVCATLKKFRSVSDRLEYIRTVRGVRYYNDTTATTPDATIAALKALATISSPHFSPYGRSPVGGQGGVGGGYTLRIILIAGGSDKNLSYKKLIPVIKKTCKAVVLLPGSATEKIKKEFGVRNVELGITYEHSMRSAVKKAVQQARRGDIVLLSPAAASFGLFQHEFDRGDKFVAAISAIE